MAIDGKSAKAARDTAASLGGNVLTIFVGDPTDDKLFDKVIAEINKQFPGIEQRTANQDATRPLYAEVPAPRGKSGKGKRGNVTWFSTGNMSLTGVCRSLQL